MQEVFIMITDFLINLLKSKRDKKRHEVIKLQWQKAELEKQLEQLKAMKEQKIVDTEQ